MYRIFIVEDDEPIRMQLKVLLEKYGYQTVVSDDFEHMVDRIEEADPI